MTNGSVLPQAGMIGAVIGYAVAGAIALAVFIALIRGGRPVRGALTNGAGGIGALLAVNLAGAFCGVSLGINAFTAGCGLLLGAPGVITLLLCKILFRLG